jgi:hypothetical protein
MDAFNAVMRTSLGNFVLDLRARWMRVEGQ